MGTSGDDVITGTTATLAGTDAIVDNSSTDNDVLNLTLNAALASTDLGRVSGIENVNLIWDAFGTATASADDIKGATITGSSSKVGFLGSFSLSEAGSNTVVAGSGMTGTLTVTGATTSVVNAGSSKTVSVTSAGSADADTLTLNANASKTVTVADFNSATINAAAATTISLTDDDNGADDGDTATLNFGVSASLTNAVDDLTVNAGADALTLTIDAVGASLDVAGTNNVTLKGATSGVFDAEVVTKSSSGTLTVEVTDKDGADNFNKVEADLFVIKAASAAGALTVKSGANVEYTTNLANATGLTVAGSGTADSVNLTLDATQGAAIAFTGVETANIATNATVSSTDVDITIASIVNASNKVVLSGSNDVTVTLVTAKTLDASAVSNNFIGTQNAASNLDVTGGTANNTFTFTGTTHSNSFTGNEAKDTVTFVNTTGSATANVSNGTNTVTANALTTGTLVVNGGAGVDTVSATALTTGTVVLSLGAGNNVVTLDGTFAGINATVETGAGNDSVTIDDATVDGDSITLNLGEGSDTLTISEDVTAGTWTVSGLEKIAIGSANTDAKVNATLLNGQTYTITGDGTSTDVLTVQFDAAGTGDFSGIVIDNTLTKGLKGLAITGSSGNDTIIGTASADTIATGGGNDTVTGGAGVDAFTANSGKDKFVFATGDVGATATTFEAIAAFNTAGDDSISFGLAGTVANYVESEDDYALTYADILAAGNAALDGTVRIAVIGDTDAAAGTPAPSAYVFFDADGDGTADMAIKLTGKAITDVSYADFVA